MKHGFALVEMAVVLVIIGLLIGGVLVGQNIIRGGKVTAAIVQIQEFDAGVIAFKDSYGDNYLPGDSPMFGGDGDGVLDWHGGGSDDLTDVYTCEMANFWYNMDSKSYVLPYYMFVGDVCDPAGVQAVMDGTSRNVPESKLGASRSFFAAYSMTTGVNSVVADKTNRRNYYTILHPSQLQTDEACGKYMAKETTDLNSPLTPVELKALDLKIDDGFANSGNVLSAIITGASSCAGYGSPFPEPLEACSEGSVYKTTSDEVCTPMIRIGGQSGGV